jgi:signal transduction histidine kinase
LTDASKHLAGLLDSRYQSLLDEWAAHAGAVPELAAQVPRLLQQLIDALRSGNTAGDGAPHPEASRLFQRGFALRAVIEELGLLQRVVLELLDESGAIVSMRDMRRLGDWFTHAVAQAAAEHERFEAPPSPAPAALMGEEDWRSLEPPAELANVDPRFSVGQPVGEPVEQAVEQTNRRARVPPSATQRQARARPRLQAVRSDRGHRQDSMTAALDLTPEEPAFPHVEEQAPELTLVDRHKDEFLAMLAHELRNPMAAISTALTLLDQGEPDVAKSARYRETARRQMTNLVRLVDDLLDVARITRGKVELRKTDVDVGMVVQHALSATRPVIEARQHELTVTLAPGTFRMQADSTRLEQVVTNLLTNAAKYTEPGGTISVHLGPDAGGRACLLSVRDTGRGIPADMLDQVFDLFTQLSPSIDRSTGGLGLGLTLVKHLVEMHGGSVSAASAGIGKGSEFSIRLPLHVTQGPAAEVAVGKAVGRVNSKRKRVVVVEDSEDVRELLKECIEQLGHEVSVARDGLEGVALIESARPELALIDVGLPGIDGYEVARRVRAECIGGAVRLVALTGYGGADVKQAARDAGFDEHVTKPIEIDRLREVLA